MAALPHSGGSTNCSTWCSRPARPNPPLPTSPTALYTFLNIDNHRTCYEPRPISRTGLPSPPAANTEHFHGPDCVWCTSPSCQAVSQVLWYTLPIREQGEQVKWPTRGFPAGCYHTHGLFQTHVSPICLLYNLRPLYDPARPPLLVQKMPRLSTLRLSGFPAVHQWKPFGLGQPVQGHVCRHLLLWPSATSCPTLAKSTQLPRPQFPHLANKGRGHDPGLCIPRDHHWIQ